MIRDNINQKIAEAMKNHDQVRLSTLRMLSSSLNYENIAKQHELTEEEELNVVRKEAKKRKDAIESFESARGKTTFGGGASMEERISKEKEELAILEEYLPAQMDDSEIEKLVDSAVSDLGAKSIQDMGRVMSAVMAKSGGRADGAKVALMVKKRLGI